MKKSPKCTLTLFYGMHVYYLFCFCLFFGKERYILIKRFVKSQLPKRLINTTVIIPNWEFNIGHLPFLIFPPTIYVNIDLTMMCF